MKKILALLLVTVGILTYSNQINAFGYYEMLPKYLIYYEKTDDDICRTIRNLQYSLVDVGFSSKPWSLTDAKNIQNTWFIGIANKNNTTVTTYFTNSGVPVAENIYNTGTLPPGIDF